MTQVSDWLVRFVDLAEAEVEWFRALVRAETAHFARTVQRLSLGMMTIVLAGLLLLCGAALSLGAIFAWLEPHLGVAGSAALTALAAFLLAAACLVIQGRLARP